MRNLIAGIRHDRLSLAAVLVFAVIATASGLGCATAIAAGNVHTAVTAGAWAGSFTALTVYALHVIGKIGRTLRVRVDPAAAAAVMHAAKLARVPDSQLPHAEHLTRYRR